MGAIRSDGRYGRPEAMDGYEMNGVDDLFGLTSDRVLERLVDAHAKDLLHTSLALRKRSACAASPRPVAGRRRGSGSAAPLPASKPRTEGLDIHFTVTRLAGP